MNRRGFCKSLAMVPAAAVAVTIGVTAARGDILIHKGNTGRLAFYKGRRAVPLCNQSIQQQINAYHYMVCDFARVEARVLAHLQNGGKVTRIYDEIIFE